MQSTQHTYTCIERKLLFQVPMWFLHILVLTHLTVIEIPPKMETARSWDKARLFVMALAGAESAMSIGEKSLL